MEGTTSKNFSFLSMIRKYVTSSVLLIFATVLALVCANLPVVKDFYFSTLQLPVSFSLGGFNFFSHHGEALTLIQVINDLLMALFFLSVGLEIKREMLVGELSSPKKALLPIIGACGGMIVPVLIFRMVCPSDPDMMRGMAIPMATDIAFSLGVLSIFGKRVPVGLKVFLATLAVADDLGGIIVIALFYSTGVNLLYLGLAAACVLILIVGNRFNLRAPIFYLGIGLILWFMMLNSGIHATIAGVILAFCVPANLHNGTDYYIERIRRNIGAFPSYEVDHKNNTVILNKDELNLLKSIESSADHLISPLQNLEDNLQVPVNFCIIPIFAFANAGIDFSEMALNSLFEGVGLAVVLGLVIGKFLGVLSFSWIAVKAKFVSMPKGANWASLASVCMLCGIGFTVSMFLADLSYSPLGETGTELLDQAKLGILCGTVIAALLGYLLLNKTLPKGEAESE